MTVEEMLEAEENSRRMFPPKAKKSKMNLLELTEDDERILDKVWAELAEEKQIEPVSPKPVKEAA
jgi:hypothetical protein